MSPKTANFFVHRTNITFPLQSAPFRALRVFRSNPFHPAPLNMVHSPQFSLHHFHFSLYLAVHYSFYLIHFFYDK